MATPDNRTLIAEHLKRAGFSDAEVATAMKVVTAETSADVFLARTADLELFFRNSDLRPLRAECFGMSHPEMVAWAREKRGLSPIERTSAVAWAKRGAKPTALDRIEAAGFADYAAAWQAAGRLGERVIDSTLRHAADLKDLFKRAELPEVEARALREFVSMEEARRRIRAERAKGDEDIHVPVRRMPSGATPTIDQEAQAYWSRRA